MNGYGDLERYADFDFFLDNYNNFYKEYGHKFIAIKNKKILGIFDSEIEAIHKISRDYPIGSFIVQECNGNESGYTNYISSWQLVGF